MPSKPALLFLAEPHEYWLGDRKLPSVTGILDRLHSFAGVPRAVLDAAKKRGSHVHAACELYDLDDLDEDAYAETEHGRMILGYLAGWKKFLAACEPDWTAIEEPVHHPLGFAGTPDRFGSLRLKGKRLPLAQVDIKTSVQSHPVWGIQTAAYNEAAGHPGIPRFTCQLGVSGTWKLLPWKDDRLDWSAFCSLLTLDSWTRKHSL